MENSSSVASASSEAGSSRSQDIEELERFIDSYVLEYQVQGLLGDKADGETEGDDGVKASQWTEDYNDKRDGSWSSSRGRGSSKPDDWDHSSNGSTGSRPSCGSRPGSGSRSDSRGRNNQFKGPAKNGNREGSLDILGTDIWAANTMDSHGGAGWDVQPEKLDLSQFHRKHYRGTPKHLPHIDREGMIKDKFEEDDGIDMSDIERFLPHLQSAFLPLPNEAEIAQTKKLFRRRRNDRRVVDPLSRDQITILLPTGPGGRRHVSARRQQRPQGSGKTPQNQAPPPPQQHLSPQHQRDPSSQQQSPNQDHHQDHQPPQQSSPDQSGESRNGTGRPSRQNQGGGHHGQRHGGPPHHGGGPPHHHGYSQNRRWHYNQKGQGPMGDKGAPPRTTNTNATTKDNDSPVRENARAGDHSRTPQQEPKDWGGGGAKAQHESAPSGPRANQNSCRDRFGPESLSPLAATTTPPPRPKSERGAGEGRSEGPKVCLLQSSKERLRRRLKDKEEASMASPGSAPQRMDRLVDLLNSMRSNSRGVEQQLASFMEEAQASARCEESLARVVATIYATAASDRSFAATAAKLCDKMALFMVEGTKFRSLLLNMLQRDFARREELQQADVEGWLGFITFLCEVFSTMRSSAGEPFRVLVLPIYTCLRELLESTDLKEDAVICCSMELQSAGRLLEAQLPEMMTDLLAAARDKMLCPAESPLTRSLLMEVIELHAHRWDPLGALTTQYYDRTIQKLTTAT